MGDVNAALGASGAGVQFDLLGKTWTLSYATKGMQAKFSAWLKRQALANLQESRDLLSKQEYAEAIAVVLSPGRYDFLGAECQEAMRRPAGMVELLRLMLEPRHPGVTTETVVDLLEADAEAVVACLQSMYPQAEGEGPPEKAPAV